MELPALPVLPDDVRDTLRSLGQPVRLFGENLANIRDRLKIVLEELKADADSSAVKDEEDEVSDENEEEEEEEVTKYTRASEELMNARAIMAKISLERSRKRLDRERWLRGEAGKRKRGIEIDPQLNEIDKYAKETFEKFQNFTLEGSQYADARAISGLCVLQRCGNTKVVSASWNATIKIWDTKAARGFRLPEATVERSQCHTDRIMGLSAATAHDVFCSTSLDATAKIWKWRDPREMSDSDENSIQETGELKGHARRLCRSAFYPGTDQFLATTSFDHTWRLWDVETAKELLLQDGHGAPVYGLSFHLDGSLLATTDFLGVIHLWDLRTAKSIRHFVGQHAKRVLQVQMLPTGFQMASAGDDGSIRIWDLRRPKRAAIQIPAHSNLITQLCVDQDEILLSSSFDGTIKAWNTRSWKLLNSLQGHDGKVSGVGIVRTNESTGIVSCGFDKTLKLWC